MINWLKDVLDRSHARIAENKESSINTMGPSIMPLQAQEKRRTSADSIKLAKHIDNQLKYGSQNNALVMHTGDCDIFVCTGCDKRTPDKIVSEPYEVSDKRIMKCMSIGCKSATMKHKDLCEMHMDTKCSVIYCTYSRDEGMPERDDLCLFHYREHQLESIK